MDGFIKYFKNTAWLLGNRAYSMLIGFFVTVLVTRYLGPENYGMLSYAISFAGLWSFVAGLGLDQVLYRDLIKDKGNENALLGSSLLLRLVSGSVAGLLAVVAALIVGESGITLWLIIIVSGAFVFQAFNVINYAFQARVHSKFSSVSTIIVVTILTALKLLVLYYHKGIYYFAAIYTLEPLLYGILFLYFYKRQYGSPRKWKYDHTLAISMLTASAPLILSAVFVSIYARIDQILIKHLIDVSSVGIYDAAVRIAELWYFIPGILVSSLFPSIVNSHHSDKKLYAKRIFRLTGLLIGLSLIIGIIVAFFARPIINIIFGSEFLGGYRVLQLYVWSGIGVSLGTILNQYLVVEKLTKVILYTSIVGMVINVILNLVLIPHYGIAGSAFATLVSYIVGPLSVVCFTSSRTKLKELFKDIMAR